MELGKKQIVFVFAYMSLMFCHRSISAQAHTTRELSASAATAADEPVSTTAKTPTVTTTTEYVSLSTKSSTTARNTSTTANTPTVATTTEYVSTAMKTSTISITTNPVTRNFAIRLVNTVSSARNPTEGRLEIYYNGTWGTVCDDQFTHLSARVACASLGFGFVGSFIENRHAGGTGRVWLENVVCVGTEQSIDRCPHSDWGSHDCSHDEDVSISCVTETVRLNNSRSSGGKPTEGQLEVFFNGIWGTVCDDGFTNASARVACASLGFGYFGATIENEYGAGTGPIWLDEVKCTGSESGIDRCQRSSWGVNDCSHNEDVSISCVTEIQRTTHIAPSTTALEITDSQNATRNFAIRLINTLSSARTPTEGRLEIYYNGTWGTVCDDQFTDHGARVACASLGFGFLGSFIENRHPGGTGRVWLDNVVCVGTEQSIDRCPHSDWGSHDCSHAEDVSIICAVAVRLNNSRSSGAKPTEGRLEVLSNGIWGTVCDDGFTNTSARVACASLGFGYIGAVISNHYGAGSGPIWLDEVTCTGRESGIHRCPHSGWGVNDCSHNEDVSISCEGNGATSSALSISTSRLFLSSSTATPALPTTTVTTRTPTTPRTVSFATSDLITKTQRTTSGAMSRTGLETTDVQTVSTNTKTPAIRITFEPAHPSAVTVGINAPNVTGDKQTLILFGIFGAILLATIVILSAVILRLNYVQSAVLSRINEAILSWPETGPRVRALTLNNPVYEHESEYDFSCNNEMTQKLCDI